MPQNPPRHNPDGGPAKMGKPSFPGRERRTAHPTSRLLPTGHGFLALSLDGAFDWLTKQPTGTDDHGYNAFIAGMDGITMGLGSFRTVLGFADWPHAKPVVVASHSLTPARLTTKVRLSTLTLIPVLIGQGLRIFGPLPYDINLTQTTPFPLGLVQLRHRIGA